MQLKYRNNHYTPYINPEANLPERYEGKYQGLPTTIHRTQPAIAPVSTEYLVKYRGVTTALHHV